MIRQLYSCLKKDLSDPYGKKKVRGWEIFEKTLPRGHRESISSSMKFIIKKKFRMMIRYLISRYRYQTSIPLYNRVSFINGPKPYRYQISKKSSLKNFFLIQKFYFFNLQNHIRNRFLTSLRNTFFTKFFFEKTTWLVRI